MFGKITLDMLTKQMKYIIVLIIAMSGAGAYLYLNPDAWPDAWSDAWRTWVKGTPLEPAPTKTRLYKWQDENGQWQITDRPPDTGVRYEDLEYSSDANIIPAVPLDE